MENQINVNLGLVGKDNSKWVLAQIDGIYLENTTIKLQDDFKNGGSGTIFYEKGKKYFVSNTHGINGIYEKVADGIVFQKGQVIKELESITSFNDLLAKLEELSIDKNDFFIGHMGEDEFSLEYKIDYSLYTALPNQFEGKDYYDNLLKYYREVNMYNDNRVIKTIENRLSITAKVNKEIDRKTVTLEQLKALLQDEQIEVSI